MYFYCLGLLRYARSALARGAPPAIASAALFLAFFVLRPGEVYAEAAAHPCFSAHGSLELHGSFSLGGSDAPQPHASLAAEVAGALASNLSVGVLYDRAQIAVQSVFNPADFLASLRYEADPARILGGVLWYAPFGVEFEASAAYQEGGASFDGQMRLSLNDLFGLRDAPYSVAVSGGASFSGRGGVFRAAIYGAGCAEYLPLFIYAWEAPIQGARGSESRLDVSGALGSAIAWSYSRDVYTGAASGANCGSSAGERVCAQRARVSMQLLEEAPLLSHIASLGAGCAWAAASESALSMLCRLDMRSDGDAKQSRAISVQLEYRRESAIDILNIQAGCRYSWACGLYAALRCEAAVSALAEYAYTFEAGLLRKRAAYQTEFSWRTRGLLAPAADFDAAYWSWRHSLELNFDESWVFRALLDWTPPAALLNISLVYRL